MTRRLLPLLAVTLLAACAQPGTTTAGPAASVAPAPSTSAPPDTLPCTKAAVDPSRSATPAEVVASPVDDRPPPSPATDEQARGQQLQRQMRSNRLFLDRHQLLPDAVPGAERCALRAEDALRSAAAKKTFDADSIRRALAAHGLPDSTVRKPATHDIGWGDGFTIAAWTGQACVVGYLSPTHGYAVEYGSQIADGGCLPAAD